MILRKLEETQPGSKTQPKLERRDFRNKVWLTRPRPEIDRVGSAWLIRKFIDPKAKFVFGNKRGLNGRVLTFDMLEGDFSHDGDDCTFETFIRRFGIQTNRSRNRRDDPRRRFGRRQDFNGLEASESIAFLKVGRKKDYLTKRFCDVALNASTRFTLFCNAR